MFSVLADECADGANIEHVGFLIRLVKRIGKIAEIFIGLEQVADTRAVSIRDAILKELKHFNLKIENCRGQG